VSGTSFPHFPKWGNEVPDTYSDGFAEDAEKGLIEFRGIVEFGSFGKKRITVEDVCKIIQ
jgi:hypothetical protein